MVSSTNESTFEFYGLSTDTKPTNTNIGNGSSFLEIDTGKIWIFDGENKVWKDTFGA